MSGLYFSAFSTDKIIRKEEMVCFVERKVLFSETGRLIFPVKFLVLNELLDFSKVI